jgi:MerR family transcriptional regulator, mercuric resistance operon regulatory protein
MQPVAATESRGFATMNDLKIGRLAEGAGVNLETVRYYERIGLMPKPARSRGGHRHYETVHVRRLTFIRRARELGFSIDDIRTLLTLAEPGRGTCAEVQKIAAPHLLNVRAKLADLGKIEKLLAEAVAKCPNDRSAACPILEVLDTPLDRADRHGLAP